MHQRVVTCCGPPRLDTSSCALMLWLQQHERVERQWRCRICQDHGYWSELDFGPIVLVRQDYLATNKCALPYTTTLDRARKEFAARPRRGSVWGQPFRLGGCKIALVTDLRRHKVVLPAYMFEDTSLVPRRPIAVVCHARLQAPMRMQNPSQHIRSW